MTELEEQSINAELTSNGMRCRMYEQRFPEVDDLVMVQVRLSGAMRVPLAVCMTSPCFSRFARLPRWVRMCRSWSMTRSRE